MIGIEEIVNDQTVAAIDKFLIDSNAFLAKTITAECRDHGLYSGTSGFLLYNRYYSFYKKGQEFISKVILDKLLSAPFSVPFHSVNFSNGFSGTLWAYFKLYQKGLIVIDPDQFIVYRDLLNRELIIYAQNRQWDNLHEAFGLLYVLVETNLINESGLSFFLEALKMDLYKGPEFIFYRAKSEYGNPDFGFNLGMAHGLAGHVLILVKVQERFPSNLVLASVLKDMVTFLLKTGASGKLDQKNTLEISHRLAWCNGILGTSMALFRYGMLTNNDQLRSDACNALIRCARQKGMRECGITDLPFCHGAVGPMHIFNRLYFETGHAQFKIASDYWLQEVLDVFEKKGLEGFAAIYKRPDKSELSPYLLVGLSGIGLALLSKLYPEVEPTWDSCLFLS